MRRVVWINGCFSSGKTTVDHVLPALADARFAQHIDAETQTAPEVAKEILRRLAA